jgi:hypothetical protein
MSFARRQIEENSFRASDGPRTRLKQTLSILSLVALLLVPAPASAQEPTSQPSSILLSDPDSADANAELRISWRAGNGEGTIVLMKQGLPVDADPVDGTAYTASSAFGDPGAEIGAGNFVVFAGAATQVTVTNLESDVPYFLALYAYSAPGGVFDYLTVAPGRRTSGHNSSHSVGCVDCHFDPVSGAFHGGFWVPRDGDQADTCKTCHNATGVASGKAAVDLHTGPNYSTVVDCGSCHEVHNSGDVLISADTHSGVTAANRQWIRSNTTKYVANGQEPALFQGRCTADGATVCNSDVDCLPPGPGGTCSSSGFFAFDDVSSPWNGLCQNCHTQTGTACCGGPRHTNDSVVAPADHLHEVTGDCMSCHTHEGQQGTDDGFTPQGGSCIGCHGQPREIAASPGTFRRQVVEGTDRRCTGDGTTICSTDGDCSAVGGSCTNGEFGVDFVSHHVNDGGGTEIVTEWDCVVCHAEGDVLTGSADGTYHQTDGVQLKDVDTGAVYADWGTLAAQQRSGFCLSCHDADGATIVAARTDPDPDATTDALNPFNDRVTNSHESDGFGSLCPDGRTTCSRNRDCNGIGDGVCRALVAPHERGRCSVTSVIACGVSAQCPAGETCQLQIVVDVASQFDTANASHHAVLGAAYASAAPFGSNVDNAIQGQPPDGRTDLAWNSTLDCEDCHYGSATNRLRGHGTANARYMLRDKAGNDTLPTPSSSGNLNVNCFRCHIPTGDPDSYDDTLSAYSDHNQGAHINDTLNLFGISCLSCHGGAEFGAIHGVDGPVTDDDGGGSYNPNVFTWGSSLDLMSNWTPGGSLSCSTRANPTLLSGCDQHGSRSWSRGETRTYRAP